MQTFQEQHEILISAIYARLAKIFEATGEIVAPEIDEDGLFVLGWDVEEAKLIKRVYKKGNDIVIDTDDYPSAYFLTQIPTDDKLTVLEFCEANKNKHHESN